MKLPYFNDLKSILHIVIISFLIGSFSFSYASGGLQGELGILDVNGNNPATGQPWQAGDQYRLVFVSSAKSNAVSNSLSDYDTFLQGLAGSAGIGGSWKVVGSSGTVDARDHTQTTGTGVAIILIDGSTVIANNYNDFWDGSLDAKINKDEIGNTGVVTSVFTGTNGNGTKRDRHLGGSDESTPKVTIGSSDRNSGQWTVVYNSAASATQSFYAMSNVLTVETASTSSYQPGLWFGELSGDINLTDENPKTALITDVASKTEDSIGNNTTEVFTGEIYDADGQISFTERIDDKTYIYIDGVLVHSDTNWNSRTQTANLNLSPGWHQIEIRISNGGGGSGPVSSPGIGYDPNGGTNWQTLSDPGDGSFLRVAVESSAPTLAGLYYGEVPGNINTTDENPETEVITNVASKTEDSIGGNTTEIYTGEIFDVDGQISFTEQIDDKTRIYINDILILSDDSWNTRKSTSNLNLAPGWNKIEIRISNGGGGSGPSGSPGIGYDPNGGSNWQTLSDPGDGSFLRVVLEEIPNNAPVADNQSLSLDQGDSLAVTLTATDADNDELTYSIEQQPSNGSLTGTAPNVTYTPNTSFSGADSFTFKANDGQDDSNSATVSITVIENQAPVALGQSLNVNQDNTLPIILSATDPENDPLTYAVVSGPANGTLSGSAPSLTYTPNGGFVGFDSFTFKANDGFSDSNTATITIEMILVNQGLTTLTGSAGGDDSWNMASNWSNGVPATVTDVIVAPNVAATVNNSSTPNYEGNLLLQENASLNIYDSIQSGHALNSATAITMETGSSLIINVNEDLSLAPITLTGDALIESVYPKSDHETTNLAAVSGAHTLTMKGFNNHTFNLTQTNSFSEFISEAYDRYNIRAGAEGAFGSGDVSISGRASDGRSAQLYLDVANTIDDRATLMLNGRGFDANTEDRITVAAGVSEIIGALIVDGIRMPEGSYDNTYPWLSGGGHLIVVPNAAPVAVDLSLGLGSHVSIPFTLSAVDENDDDITFTILTQPEHGTLSGTVPNLVYTPTPGYIGFDSFTFMPNDGLLDAEDVGTIAFQMIQVNLVPATWTGSGPDNRWSTPGNWENNVLPSFYSEVIFDDTSAKNCEFDVNVEVSSIIVKNSYQGSISGVGSNVTLTTADLEIEEGYAGQIQLGDANLAVKASLEQSGGVFSSNNGAIVLAGSEDQEIRLSNSSAVNLTVTNTGGEVEILESISVDVLTLNPGSFFKVWSGETVTATSLVADGNYYAPVVLLSSVAGETYNLNISTANPTVSFIHVSDCNATGSNISALNNGLDGGNNTNWSFTANPDVTVGIVVPSVNTSVVSPASLELKVLDPSLTIINARCLGQKIFPQYLSDCDVFFNVPLSAIAPTITRIELDQELGLSKTTQVTWTATDLNSLDASDDEIIIRQDDSLLFTCSGVGDFRIDHDGDGNYGPTQNAGDQVPTLYNTTGNYTVSCQQMVNGSFVEVGTYKVKVVSGSVGATAAQLNFGRFKNIQTSSAEDMDIVASSDRDLKTYNISGSGTGLSLHLQPLTLNKQSLVLRTKGSNLIIDAQNIEFLVVETNTVNGISIIEEYEDGSYLLEEKIKFSPPHNDLVFELRVFVGGVTFDDFSLEKSVNNSEFQPGVDGTYSFFKVRLIKDPTVAPGPCHLIEVYQEGRRIGRIN